MGSPTPARGSLLLCGHVHGTLQMGQLHPRASAQTSQRPGRMSGLSHSCAAGLPGSGSATMVPACVTSRKSWLLPLSPHNQPFKPTSGVKSCAVQGLCRRAAAASPNSQTKESSRSDPLDPAPLSPDFLLPGPVQAHSSEPMPCPLLTMLQHAFSSPLTHSPHSLL